MPDWVDIELLERLLAALAVVLVILLLVRLTKRLATRYIDDPERLFRFSKFVGRTGGILAVILVVIVLSINRGDLITLLTVAGAGLAIAMREMLLSVAAWVYIAFRSPYRHGDRIESNGIVGDVVDVRVLHTIVMEIGGWVDADQSTGRLVNIPNSYVFLHGVFNYTRGFHFIWNEIVVTLTFRSNWEDAAEIMRSLAQESADIIEQQARNEIKQMAREFLIYYTVLTPFVYVRIVPNGIRLSLRYLCEVRKRRGTEHALTMGILQAFLAHGDIEFAYPMVGVATYDSPQFGPLAPTKGMDGTPGASSLP